jgi:signal transduction histidine kinase
LVEDDEDDYVLIKDLLSEVPEKSFNLEWTHDYDAGIEAIGSERHDVCLLDYHLGDRNGLELMRMGAADYLLKGQIDSTMLERSIRYAISHKQMEMQLLETSRLASIGKLAAGMAHEINNPLTSVLGFSQLLMAKNIPDDIAVDLNIINAEAKRAAKIVQNLLLFARKTEPEMRYLDVTSLLYRVQELKSFDFKTNRISVINEVPPDLPRTMVDEHQLIQVFINILTNAEQECFASQGGGQLRIQATSSPNWIRISISDDGPGISPEKLNAIFEPFYTTKDVGKGTGLGLSICYGIIRQHGGNLWAESELGKGAIFHIELPIVLPADSAESPTVESASAPIVEKHLLVVDDEPHIRDLLARSLEMQHYTVDLAEEGKEAFRKLNTMSYDCILLDLKMPGMNGKEVFQLMEESDPQVAKKVIFITGDASDTDTRDFIAKSSNPVVLKPFHLDDVCRQVLNVVQGN